jgi:hypothetical protein
MTLSHDEDSAKDEAQKYLATLPIQAGDWYVHYKGGEYEVIALALKEDTLEPLVVYRSPSHNNTVWARVYSNWNSDVEVDGKMVKRFVKK